MPGERRVGVAVHDRVVEQLQHRDDDDRGERCLGDVLQHAGEQQQRYHDDRTRDQPGQWGRHPARRVHGGTREAAGDRERVEKAAEQIADADGNELLAGHHIVAVGAGK